MKPNLVTLRVWGDFACFTRPEMKVERVSYPVITPSAARGVLEAVFWEPQMYYLVDSVRIVKKGRWVSFRRNEVTKVISLESVQKWMRAPATVQVICADDQGSDGSEGQPRRDATRAQRNMLALEDVEYLISAEVHVAPLANRPEDSLAKYLGEIERRARQGKCFHRPALGMREFAADFEWEPDADAALVRRIAELGQAPERFDEDLGLMLYDVFDHHRRAAGFRWLREEEMAVVARPAERRRRNAPQTEQVRWAGNLIRPQAAFFHAHIKQSKLDCHPGRIQILAPNAGGN
jgi:CRISPR-associated protein Cas5d